MRRTQKIPIRSSLVVVVITLLALCFASPFYIAPAQAQLRSCRKEQLIFENRVTGQLNRIVDGCGVGLKNLVPHGNECDLHTLCETGNLFAWHWRCLDGDWTIVQPVRSWCPRYSHCTLSEDARALACDGTRRNVSAGPPAAARELVPALPDMRVEELTMVHDNFALAILITGDRLRVLNMSHSAIQTIALTYFLKLEVLDVSHNRIASLSYSSLPVFSRLRYIDFSQNPGISVFPITFTASMAGCGWEEPPFLAVGPISATSHASNCGVMSVPGRPDCHRAYCPSTWRPKLDCPPLRINATSTAAPAGGSSPARIEARLLCDGVTDCEGGSDEGLFCQGMQMAHVPEVHSNTEPFCDIFVPCMREVVMTVRTGIISIQASRSTLSEADSCFSLIFVALYRTDGWYRGMRTLSGRLLRVAARFDLSSDYVDIKLLSTSDVQFTCLYRLRLQTYLTRDEYLYNGIQPLHEFSGGPSFTTSTSTSTTSTTTTTGASTVPQIEDPPEGSRSAAPRSATIIVASALALVTLLCGVGLYAYRRRQSRRRVAVAVKMVATPSIWIQKAS